MAQNRQPKETQAWLIGGGIASLAAAVHLIQKAKVPAPQIHILDVHKASGGAMEEVSGNLEDGYVLHTGAQLYFHEQCVEELLRIVPSQVDPEKSVLQSIKDRELQGPTNTPRTRTLRLDEQGRLKADTHRMHVGIKLRMALVAFIMDHERASDSRQIKEVFEESFFQTDFWALWSTTFFLQPWHSATEFRRLLIKYLPNFQTYDGVTELERTRFSSHESLVVPITQYLKNQGVDFRFQALVTGLQSYPSSDPTTISEITMLEDGKEKLVTLDPSDIVIVTLGSISTGMRTGSNKEPPVAVPTESFKDGNWSLWDQLASQSSKFGNPVAFYSRADEAKIATFTVTFRESSFMGTYLTLIEEKSATGSLLTITGSPWGLHISVPCQPVIAAQPPNVDLVWGYGLHPEKEGTYVKKPMEQCSGEEILFELLSHMKMPTESLLPSATTVPSLVPLGTSMLLTRVLHDRPNVIPHNTTNVAFIGQYVEIPDDTTFSVEYSVRGAQIAVSRLMGLGQGAPKISKNIPLEIFHLLV